MGVLKSFAGIYKQGKRNDLLPHAPIILETILNAKYSQNHNGLLRKLSLKVVQRLGLTFLKTKVAAWRYKRGSRSLALNLESGANVVSTVDKLDKSQHEEEVEEEEDYDIPEEIEAVIEELLCGLKDKETVARWSAAKGLYY